MGLAKVIKVSDRKVRIVHQLDTDGRPYAEDVTIEVAESVDPSRLDYLASQDGKVGVFSFGFSPTEAVGDGVRFPGDELADDGAEEPATPEVLE